MFNAQKSIKVYVPVEVSFDEKGRMYPRRIHWEDGQTYDVDRILDARPAYAARVRLMRPASGLCGPRRRTGRPVYDSHEQSRDAHFL